MKNNKFQHGTIKCTNCGKLTRDTGKGEFNLELCAKCIEVVEWVNSINDGDFTLEDVPEELRSAVEENL